MVTTKTFTNNPNFKSYKIGHLLDFHQRSCKLEPDQVYQLVTVKRRNEGIVSRGIFKGSDIKTPSQFYIKDGDFLISKRQIVHGACEIVPSEFDGAIVSNEYTIATGKEDKVLTKYFNLLSKTNFMKNHYFLSSYGVDIEKMVFNLEDWKKRLVNIPSIEEQRKVIAFFDVMENKIQLQWGKINLLKKQKIGYLQKIFSQEMRFKKSDGQEYPEWKNFKLNELANYISSNISIEQYKEFKGEEFYPLYDANKIICKIDSYSFEENYISIIKDGAGVGRIRLLPGKSSIVGTMGAIQSKDLTIVGTNFLYYFLQKVNFNKYVSGSTIPHIYFKDYGNEIVSLPCIKEQEKIISFLSSIDSKIQLEKLKYDIIVEQKKAFMQQIFI